MWMEGVLKREDGPTIANEVDDEMNDEMNKDTYTTCVSFSIVKIDDIVIYYRVKRISCCWSAVGQMGK